MPCGPRALLRVRWSHGLRPWLRPRALSSRSGPERVNVRCGAAGHVSVDLFNGAHDARNRNALVIHLPAFPAANDAVAPLPPFLEHLPVAQINYRWGGLASRVLHWPTPVHDTAFAYDWLFANLAPPRDTGRDMFVYGSQLGASLAASLALTETHAHASFGIRGLVTYNGIYNWTMFLPDHRINKSPTIKHTPVPASRAAEKLKGRLSALFHRPADLFDPYASPSLFFHSPGLLAPRVFAASTDDAVWDEDEQAVMAELKPPRAVSNVFPPRKSSLRIPETLLLYHDGIDQSAASGNSLRAQARELAVWMRRGIVESEKKLATYDHDDANEESVVEDTEAKLRVQFGDPGPLADKAEAMALEWMRERSDAM
ncbi:hypothetical protein XA68_15449 [Ophiocordyceps unilateralis]|uniref:Uncharacterized protein n=1 Tax=Ophiocordyceps unilateralis TaxID=268505 RepID=A0A2A9PM98_OPHUN|nr:hypothetical protein XA68_15449 [Ophiocordyceps unilateralis]